MSTVDDRTIAAFLAGALEPGLELEVQEHVAAYPEVRDRAALLAARFQQERMLDDTWDLPPPGFACGARPFAARTERAFVMGSLPGAPPDVHEPGARLPVVLDDRPDADAVFLVGLLRGPQGERLWFPNDPDEVMLLSELPLTPAEPDQAGGRLLQLSVPLEPGRYTLTIALPPREMVPDWSQPEPERWAAVRQGIEDGSVAATTLPVFEVA